MKSDAVLKNAVGLLVLFLCLGEAKAELALVQLCPKVSQTVIVDGRVDTQEWSDAAVVSGFNTGEARNMVTVQTLAYAKRTDKSLLLGIVMLEPKMDKLFVGGVGRDGKLWWNDSIEIFLDPGRSKKDYFHFIIGADGTLYDARVKDKGWDAQFESAVHHGKDRWSVELEIPFELMEAHGAPGQIWGVNYCRTRRNKQPVGGAWSSVPGGNHQPQRFGVLYFSESINVDDGQALTVAEKMKESSRIFVKGGFVDVRDKKVSRYQFESAGSETFKRSTEWAAKLKACCETAKPSKPKAEALKLLADWDVGTTDTSVEQMPILKWVASCRTSDEMVQKMRRLYWEIKLSDLYREIDK